MKSLLVVLSILCVIAAPSYGAGKHDGGPARIDSLTTSTFDLGGLISVQPLDTVALPLYLLTDSTVTYVENRIVWNDTQLDLVNLTQGPGLSGATLEIMNWTAGDIQFKLTAAGGSAVGTDPIAYLNFEVQCYGYGQLSVVDFYGDNNDNFFIAGGLPYSPARDLGSVITRNDDSWVYSNGVVAYVAEQDIPLPVNLYQTTKGRVETVVISYDYNQFVADSVTAGDLDGGSASITFDVGGLMVVAVNSPDLEPGTWKLFDVHFRSQDDDDSVLSTVTIDQAVRITACADTLQPGLSPGYLEIPNHTASVDLGNVNAYTSTAYYDVPVVFDSNMPVDAYELWLDFPSDDIDFAQVVERAGFTPPTAAVDTSSGTPRLNLNNGYGTHFEPGDLPATVCYLRFEPTSTPSVGDDFVVSFVDPHPENEIQYYTDLGAFHDAEITALLPGTIHISSSGGGNPCCPALYAWDGSEFVLENNILAQCDGKVVESHVTDYYRVEAPVKDDDGLLRFQVRENAEALSEFGDFELLVVDHKEDEDLLVTRDGEILVANQPFAIEWARDHTGRDIKSLIETPDKVVYQSTEDGWFEVSLGALSEEQVGKFAAGTHDALQKRDCPILKSQGIDLKKGRKLHVSVREGDGTWRQIAESDARHNPVRQTAVITPEMIRPGEELVLRYSWESFYRIDVLEFNGSVPFDGDIVSAPLVDASLMSGEKVVQLQPAGGAPLTLAPGEEIDVVFDATDLPQLAAGQERDYVFVTTGKYTEPDAIDVTAQRRGFALDANVPNPFNPTTTIGYNLAAPVHVELSVYDVRGALVRTLVSGHQGAGEKSVVWDGTSNVGTPLASGVYFYRLRAGNYQQTRKMVLLK